MLRSLKVIFFICGFLAFLVSAALGIAYYLASNSLPIYNQTYLSKNIKDSVTITRDSFAVPYIRGTQDTDSVFALGYAHAQDRLWQMELHRRTAQGRLSEIIGPTALKEDILMRTLGIYKLAQSSEKHQSLDIQQLLKSYSSGVNAYINQISKSGLGRGSPEFFLFTSKIAPWTPTDCIALLKLIGLKSTNKAQMEILRTRLILENVDKSRINDLLGEPPFIDSIKKNKHTSLRDLFKAQRTKKNIDIDNDKEGYHSNSYEFNGLTASNIFAAMPSRSASGASLLASDPHGYFSVPSTFMLVGMELENGPVIGGTIPGIPAILIGRNKTIGWGLSNAYIDDQDLYIEKMNPENKREYYTSSGLAKVSEENEIINIKGEKPITLSILKTRNGPILPQNIYGVRSIRPEGHEISINWTGLSSKDRSIESFISLMRSSTIEEATRNLSLLTVPGQNILLADKENIGIFMGGAVPNRNPLHKTRGKIPSLGWHDENYWRGMLPFETNPSTSNPDSGILVNTNNKIIERSFPNHISFDWGDSQRIIRAKNLLEKRQFHTTNSFIEIQNDTVSVSARILLPLLAKNLWFKNKNFDGMQMPKLVEESLEILSEWNGDMDQNLIAPLIYVGWAKEFQKSVMNDELGDLYAEFKNINPLFLERVLRNKKGAASWCDIIQTEKIETCDYISQQSLMNAILKLEKKFGSDIMSWRWGEAHIAIHKSKTFKKWPFLALFTNIIHEASGGSNTLLMSRLVDPQNELYGANYGSTLRAVYDFSSDDSALFIISTGQSCHFLSRHYDDQSILWQKQEYLSLKLSINSKIGAPVGSLTFHPNLKSKLIE